MDDSSSGDVGAESGDHSPPEMESNGSWWGEMPGSRTMDRAFFTCVLVVVLLFVVFIFLIKP